MEPEDPLDQILALAEALPVDLREAAERAYESKKMEARMIPFFETIAALANSILANYEKHGKIVRTDSKPRTPQRPAEHLIVAILGNATLLEAVFARILLIDGVGMVAVYSHRVYGGDAAGPIGEWMQTNGPTIEKNLMTWDKIPSPAALKRLPQRS